MAAGVQLTRAEINNRAAAVVRGFYVAMRDVDQFKEWLAGVNLESEYAFSAADAADLVSAINDLADLAVRFRGGTPAKSNDVYDYRTFARRLIGTGNY